MHHGLHRHAQHGPLQAQHAATEQGQHGAEGQQPGEYLHAAAMLEALHRRSHGQGPVDVWDARPNFLQATLDPAPLSDHVARRVVQRDRMPRMNRVIDHLLQPGQPQADKHPTDHVAAGIAHLRHQIEVLRAGHLAMQQWPQIRQRPGTLHVTLALGADTQRDSVTEHLSTRIDQGKPEHVGQQALMGGRPVLLFLRAAEAHEILELRVAREFFHQMMVIIEQADDAGAGLFRFQFEQALPCLAIRLHTEPDAERNARGEEAHHRKQQPANAAAQRNRGGRG